MTENVSTTQAGESANKLIKPKKPWYKRGEKQNSSFMSRWFFGLLKEFRRIQWMKGHDIIENIFVVLITILILIGLFAAIDAIFLNGNILGG